MRRPRRFGRRSPRGVGLAPRGKPARRARKRRRAAGRGSAEEIATTSGGAGNAAADGTREVAASRPYARSEAKNEAIRASLEPLEEGERPRAVTVGAVVAAVSAVTNAAYALGIGVDDPEQSPIGPLVFSVLMLVIAWGMWHARYWAVLGMQALLAISLIVLTLFVLIQASATEAVLLVALAILPLGVLFWFLVRAMARIQMPARR